MNHGIYLAIFRLPHTQTITIGQLGRFRFGAGIYLYVGSAQRNLQARLARHARSRKTFRWQIDYLSTKAEFLGALMIEGPKSLECKLAALLAKHYPRPVPRFGASDCWCGGHLFLNADGGAKTMTVAGRQPSQDVVKRNFDAAHGWTWGRRHIAEPPLPMPYDFFDVSGVRIDDAVEHQVLRR